MKAFYKIFLIVLIIFTGINIYAINWNLGVFNSENDKFLFSISAGIVGIILVFILNVWSKLKNRSLNGN